MKIRERTRESRHREWLAEQAYSQAFFSPSIIWAKWIDNQSHKCKCGCDGVWHGPGNGANLLAYLFPIVLFRFLRDTKALYPAFRAVYAFWQAALLVVLRIFLREWVRVYRAWWLSIF